MRGIRSGGGIFRYAMLPYVMYLVFRCDARYLPALVLHCCSETMILPVIYVSMGALSCFRYRQIRQAGAHRILLVLLLLAPIFVRTVVQRYLLTLDLNVSLISVIYYLSFFCIGYGVLIARNMSYRILDACIFVIATITLVSYMGVAVRLSMVGGAICINYCLYTLFSRRPLGPLWLLCTATAVATVLMANESTFTVIGTCIFSMALMYFYRHNHFRVIKTLTGLLPFLGIFLLMNYAINNYQRYGDNFDNVEGSYTDFSDLSGLSDRARFKLFGDRAPYWAGAWDDIRDADNPVPPLIVPEVTATMQDGREIDVTFGGHNTYLELLRQFGWLCGGLLILLFMRAMIVGRRILTVPHLPNQLSILLCSAFAFNLIISLSGTAFMGSASVIALTLVGCAWSLQHYLLKNPAQDD
ncbi:MAG: hypothetical protein ACLSGU_02520 [Alistipes sp.]